MDVDLRFDPMPDTLPAILMLQTRGKTPAEKWVGEGRLAAALDLVTRLRACEQYDPIFVIAEDPSDEEKFLALGAEPERSDQEPFHFGRALEACIRGRQLNRFAYFGGASAPLLTPSDLQRLHQRIIRADSPLAIANNLYSTDWFLSNDVTPIHTLVERLPSDNPLGWVYSKEAGILVQSEPASAATRLDIDTPMDLAMLLGHPHVGPHLKRFMETLPKDIIKRVIALRGVLKTPAETLTVIGRASSNLWHQLEEQTQIWVRLFVEERGMVASRRLERGDVRSVIASLLRTLGPEGFIQLLSELSSAVLWDTRVWMAAELGWPNAGDRFAADLGWSDDIEEPRLREFTQAIGASPIPLIAGGYGVVSGGMYALLESMASD